MIEKEKALKGRDAPIATAESHFVFGGALQHEIGPDEKQLIVGLGCFWGAEKRFWQQDGVISTAVGYAAGFTLHPTYEEVCSGSTGHNEVVRVVYDPARITLEQLLTVFWEAHNPTQGMRQGNDKGTQYRSGIYLDSVEALEVARTSQQQYQQALTAAGFPNITTEVLMAGPFYYAEGYHQQYLAKNPNGYCGLGGTGVGCSG
ncbi:peptide-methionine (S)-S-oxide reductase [Gammaproteobacteria bacterium 45_16_T64]|nr:peptide-methionine (S)-S-oxide reductase [Gammaproteobacteria bacterium 45_16_T64]